jgi:hypothetical protein
MTKQITLEEALKLVEFKNVGGVWQVRSVKGSVYGDVHGAVFGDVCHHVFGDVGGSVLGDVGEDVYGDVGGSVRGTINGLKWQPSETPKGKLERLIKEGATKEQLIEACNQLEES